MATFDSVLRTENLKNLPTSVLGKWGPVRGNDLFPVCDLRLKCDTLDCINSYSLDCLNSYSVGYLMCTKYCI